MSDDQMAWVADALCAQTDPEAFFPRQASPNARAKQVCHACPAESPCLEWALDQSELYGVWGGTSDADRRKLKRARRAA